MFPIIAKMFICLLISFLLGLAIGWWIWGALKQWKTKYEKISEEKTKLDSDFQETNTKLGSVSKELEIVQGDLNTAKDTLSTRSQRVGELDGELSEWKNKYSLLEGDYSTAQSKINELGFGTTAAATTGAVAAAGAVAATSAVHAASAPGNTSAEVKSLTVSLERCRARYQSLWERNQVWSMRLAELESKTGEVEAPNWLLSETTAGHAKDDLKEIKGVGPVMEETMNKLGIFYFAQIAQMSPRDVAWITSKIETFPDRIYRDKWLEQAEHLANRHL